MSSIYRKGRDGYFYYQTYVYNSETGKKDKRIFHSLSTKDRISAQEKQNVFDRQYEQRIGTANRIYIKWLKVLFSLIIISLILNSFLKRIQSSSIPILRDDHALTKPIQKFHIKEKDSLSYPEDKILMPSIQGQNDELVLIEKEPSLNNDTILKAPKYSIEKIELLSDIFKQGKIFVVVNEDTDSKNLKLLCDKIVVDFPEFSNLVICIYADNKVGRDLANGNDFGITNYEKKISWLAMYTNNSVEGAYFDDNPSRYLGL